MTDLDVSLLVAALRFARPGADQLVTTVCSDPETMLRSLLGQTPSATQLTALDAVSGAVQSDLTRPESPASSSLVPSRPRRPPWGK